jgi:peptidyl-prolyl cis-trans isomerase SurA
MRHGCRWIGASLIGACGLALGGCMTGAGSMLPQSVQELAADLKPEDAPTPRLARSQRPETGGVSLRRPTSADAPALPGPPESAAQPTSLANRGPGSVHMNVRAWINGKPIFDDEVFYLVGPDLRRVQQMAEPRRSEVLNDMLATALDSLIDQELLYQDGVSKLEVANPRALDKLKEYVGQQFDSQVARMEKAGVPPEHIKEISPVARRVLQRSLISQEYVRSRIMPFVENTVNLELIREYYEGHKNEFQTVDKLKWQDVFIAAGPGQKHATVAEARRYAEQLLASCRTSDDFTSLIQHDDGDSKPRGGEGLGHRRGEISPVLLEDYLFRLREGEIGPIVEMPSGVHLIRVVKREYAGQIPLNETTQKTIRRKLQNQLADIESKRIVRELKARAIIRKENRGADER